MVALKKDKSMPVGTTTKAAVSRKSPVFSAPEQQSINLIHAAGHHNRSLSIRRQSGAQCSTVAINRPHYAARHHYRSLST